MCTEIFIQHAGSDDSITERVLDEILGCRSDSCWQFTTVSDETLDRNKRSSLSEPFSMKSLWSITSKLPEEYDIRLTATRRSGAHALCIGLPISGSRGVVLFDISEAPYSGLEKIDGLLIGLNSSYTPRASTCRRRAGEDLAASAA